MLQTYSIANLPEYISLLELTKEQYYALSEGLDSTAEVLIEIDEYEDLAKNRLYSIRYNDPKGFPHREDGPAYISWFDTQLKSREEYYKHGNRHRNPLQGPAIQTWSITTDGSDYKIRTQEYWWKNERVEENFIPPREILIQDGLGRTFV